MRRRNRTSPMRLANERLESRLALDGDGGDPLVTMGDSSPALGDPPVDVGIFMPSSPGDGGVLLGVVPLDAGDAGPDTPWIRFAEAATTGAVVFRIRLSVTDDGAVTDMAPIWSRANDPSLPDPLLAIDPTTGEPAGSVDGLVTGAVFGGEGSDPSATWPMTLDEFSAAPPAPTGAGTQVYYVVLQSPSNVLLGLVSTVVLLVDGGTPIDGGVTGDGGPVFPTDGGDAWTIGGGDVIAMAGGVAGGFGPSGFVNHFGGIFQRHTPPEAPGVALANDTGADTGDRVTSDGTLVVAAGVGAKVEYSVNGGRTWSATPPRDAEGTRTVLVRQTDAFGQISPATSFTATIDRRAPQAPKLGLADGTPPGAADPVRRSAAPAPRGIEAGARVEYSAAGGAWTSAWPVQEGANSIRVRQIDAAGNVSAPSAPLRFRIDSVAAAPTVRLARDTGWSATDLVTSDATLALGGVEAGAKVQYSIDGGQHWATRVKPVDGTNTILVRQIDAVGNVSDATSFAFVVDRTPPALPANWAAAFTGLGGIVPAARSESPVRYEYAVRGGAWVPLPAGVTLPQGRSWLRVRVVDRAGNASAPSPVVWGTGR